MPSPSTFQAVLDKLTLSAIQARSEAQAEGAGGVLVGVRPEHARYQGDPVGFATEVLGETFTPDVIRVMQSVSEYPVTIAKSGNGTGKCAAHGEQIVLADGSRIAVEELIGRTFDVHSVDKQLNVRVSAAFATDNGVQPVVRITTASGKAITRTLNHPLAKPPAHLEGLGYRYVWGLAGDLKPGDELLAVGRLAMEALPPVPIAFAWEKVDGVELLGEMPTVAITVPGDETFLTDLVEHNTHASARIALWWYLCHPGAQVYTSAAPPESNLRNLLWGELGGILAKHPQLLTGHRAIDLRISRSDREFITGVTIPSSGSAEQRQARFSGKHAPYLLFIVDEGDAVPDFVYRGIESCLSGGVGRLLIMFNPRGRIGPVYRMERQGIGHVVEMTALNHPNVVTGDDLMPGAVDRPTTVRRINEWTRPLGPQETPDSQCFEVPDYLVGVVGSDRLHRPFAPLPAGWRKVTDNQFSHMVLARYPASSTDQLISEEWIDGAVTRWHTYVARFGELPPKSSRAILGVDVGELGSDASAVALRYGGWVPHLITWTGVDVLVSGERAAEIFIERNGMRINVDSTGVGAGVAPQAARSLRAKGVKVNRSDVNRVMVAESPTKETPHGQFAMLRDQLLWEVREWLREDPGAMLPPDDELRDELLAFTYESNQRGKIKVTDKASLRERLGRSPNKADALALTFAPETRKLALALI